MVLGFYLLEGLCVRVDGAIFFVAFFCGAFHIGHDLHSKVFAVIKSRVFRSESTFIDSRAKASIFE